MRSGILILFFVLNSILHSQNWNAFNKNYRYNYKYNYSNLVSNVLFVDTVKQSGADTIYTMNRIGVECTGSCPTVTTALSPTVHYVVPNMPQFLQRCIKKYSNGLVELFDTTKIVIVPTCTLNQTWLFDSIFNKTAVCASISALSVFGITDSIKTILIQNVDTLILSKSFGILQFPDPYAKNKYYRLVGIEKKSSYDATPFYGERVPNAWDFYNYDVGDVFCTKECSSYYATPPSQFTQQTKLIVNGKTITPTGYSYNFNSTSGSFNYGCGLPPGYTYSLSNYTSNLALTSGTLFENSMYPNMIYTKYPNPGGYWAFNIVKFGTDNTGRFYKYCGRPCSNYASPILPNLNATRVIENYNTWPYQADYMTTDQVGLCLGVGFGKVSDIFNFFEGLYSFCLTSFTKSNNFYFGTCFDALGIPENQMGGKNPIIYPNPVNNILKIHLYTPSNVQIIDPFGKLVHSNKLNPGESIDVSPFTNGVYFVVIKNSDFSIGNKVIIQH